MKLLLFLVLGRYGLAWNYRITSETAIYNWIHFLIPDIKFANQVRPKTET